MQPTFRPYQCEDDFWRMREFLRQVFVLNERLERNWHVSRLEYARWHTCLNCAKVRLEDVAFLWELDGRLRRTATTPPGTATSRPRPSTAATWTWWPSRRMGPSPPSAPSGSTT